MFASVVCWSIIGLVVATSLVSGTHQFIAAAHAQERRRLLAHVAEMERVLGLCEACGRFAPVAEPLGLDCPHCGATRTPQLSPIMPGPPAAWGGSPFALDRKLIGTEERAEQSDWDDEWVQLSVKELLRQPKLPAGFQSDLWRAILHSKGRPVRVLVHQGTHYHLGYEHDPLPDCTIPHP